MHGVIEIAIQSSNIRELYTVLFTTCFTLRVRFVVSDIQRIGCQPEKTTLHGGQSRSWSAEQGKENKRKSLAAYPPHNGGLLPDIVLLTQLGEPV